MWTNVPMISDTLRLRDSFYFVALSVYLIFFTSSEVSEEIIVLNEKPDLCDWNRIRNKVKKIKRNIDSNSILSANWLESFFPAVNQQWQLLSNTETLFETLKHPRKISISVVWGVAVVVLLSCILKSISEPSCSDFDVSRMIIITNKANKPSSKAITTTYFNLFLDPILLAIF